MNEKIVRYLQFLLHEYDTDSDSLDLLAELESLVKEVKIDYNLQLAYINLKETK